MKRLILVLVTAFVFCLIMPGFAQEVKMEKVYCIKVAVWSFKNWSLWR